MVTMLHYDAAYPIPGHSLTENPAKHVAYLDQHSYEPFSQHELDEVSQGDKGSHYDLRSLLSHRMICFSFGINRLSNYFKKKWK